MDKIKVLIGIVALLVIASAVFFFLQKDTEEQIVISPEQEVSSDTSDKAELDLQTRNVEVTRAGVCPDVFCIEVVELEWKDFGYHRKENSEEIFVFADDLVAEYLFFNGGQQEYASLSREDLIKIFDKKSVDLDPAPYGVYEDRIYTSDAMPFVIEYVEEDPRYKGGVIHTIRQMYEA